MIMIVINFNLIIFAVVMGCCVVVIETVCWLHDWLQFSLRIL